MAYRDTQAARSALAETAAAQGGYFTAKQAAAAGYSRQHVGYHVAAGNFERVERGLFRLPALPRDEHDELIRLSLWSRGRDDRPQAVISHQTALALHDLGESLPGKVHLTVPQTFRKAAPKTCVLHRGHVDPKERARWSGFEVTTPLRTLVDLSVSDSMPFGELVAAVEDALGKGLVRRTALVQSVRKRDDLERLARVLEETA